jgi:tellurite resistance protein TerC
MDSIPAILVVTRDPFIVYTSNIFAIIGLRSFYHFLANIIDMFAFLPVQTLTGVKMLTLITLSDTHSHIAYK